MKPLKFELSKVDNIQYEEFKRTHRDCTKVVAGGTISIFVYALRIRNI